MLLHSALFWHKLLILLEDMAKFTYHFSIWFYPIFALKSPGIVCIYPTIHNPPFLPPFGPPAASCGPLTVSSSPFLQPLSVSSSLIDPASSLAPRLYVLLCLVLLSHSAPIEVCFSSAPMPYFLPGQSLPFFTCCNPLWSRKAL